jgi:3-keto-L-gulonate-6-phosphate decarboxylase
LKKVGWDMNQYSRVAREAEAQFDYASHGSISRDHQGSRRKKQSSKRSSKKSGSKKRGDKGEEVGFIAGGLPTGEAAQLSQVSIMVVVVGESRSCCRSEEERGKGKGWREGGGRGARKG